MPDGSVEEVSADHVVLAAGARPLLPDVEGLEDTPFHTCDSIMRIDSLPEHLFDPRWRVHRRRAGSRVQRARLAGHRRAPR